VDEPRHSAPPKCSTYQRAWGSTSARLPIHIANAFYVAAINGGRHVAPLFAGATVFAWSEVLARAELPGRSDVGALRLRTVATKDRPCHDFPLKSGSEDDPAVVLELDYWVLLPL